MKKVILGLAVFAIGLSTSAQIQSGSVAVVASSKDEIVIAADSRRITGDSYIDSACKIAALGNKLIFVAVGHTGFGPPNAPAIWDSQTLAHNEFIRLQRKHTADDLTLALAKAWGNATKIKVQEMFTKYGNAFLVGLDGNDITSAAFAGFAKTGEVSLLRSVISYQTTKTGLLATSRFDPIHIAPGEMQGLGEGDIAVKINSNTPEGVQLRQEAEADAKSGQWADPTVFWPIEAVKLTVEHHVGKVINGRIISDVGGKTDAVSLLRSDGVHWIQRKDNCPEN